jgi:sec-independent protein translocase protein TatA
MLGGLGMTELLVIAGIATLIFGPRQLPKLGRAMGDTIREMRGVGKELQALHEDEDADADR